jgi:CBS domain containing-hemolysin-like protein
VYGITLIWTLAVGLPVLAVHLVSVTLSRAMRTYSRIRLEEVCAERGHPERVDEVAHHDARTERAAEVVAVTTGLALAALLGVAVDRRAPIAVLEAVLGIALTVGALGYVLAGVIGRVFAEPVVDRLWPAARWLRMITSPLTFCVRQVEAVVERFAHEPSLGPRPSSVEVEIPADSNHPEDLEADLPESTRSLLQHALTWTRRDVSELMTPRSSIVTLPSSVSAQAAARIFRETGKSRVPLYGENRDDIIGVLYAKDLFPKMTDVSDPSRVVPRELARAPLFVPESKNAYDLMDSFRTLRTQLAIVLDEYGGVAGLITLEDLVEDLVGAIDDEHDVPTPPDTIVPLGGSLYEVDASMAIDDLNDRLDVKLPTDADFETVAGFAFHALGRIPEPGASFQYDGVKYQIVEVADHSIRRLLIDLQPAATVS